MRLTCLHSGVGRLTLTLRSRYANAANGPALYIISNYVYPAAVTRQKKKLLASMGFAGQVLGQLCECSGVSAVGVAGEHMGYNPASVRLDQRQDRQEVMSRLKGAVP